MLFNFQIKKQTPLSLVVKFSKLLDIKLPVSVVITAILWCKWNLMFYFASLKQPQNCRRIVCGKCNWNEQWSETSDRWHL